MQNIGFAIWIVCALVSFVLTLPYLNVTGFGFLVYPLFPFFGIYAGSRRASGCRLCCSSGHSSSR